MIKEIKVGAIVFFVEDLAKTKAFYESALAFSMNAVGETEPELYTAQLGDLELVFLPGESKPGNSPVVVFTPPEGEIENILTELVEKNVEIITPLSHAPDGGMTFDFADPNGYILSFYQAAV